MNDIELLKKENDELRLTINGSVLQIQAMQLQINAMKIGQKVLDGAIQTKSISNSEWREKYMREVEGLNNEGDPIGGDPPSGLRHAIEYFKAENAAQQKKISELEDRLSSFPIPTTVAMQKISKLRQRGFKEYAATVLKSQSDGYCIVGDYGDVRWITVYCEEPKEG